MKHQFEYRLATSRDLIDLKSKYPNDLLVTYQWGLKQAGTLYCVDKILKTDSQVVLELGAGHTLFFDKYFFSKASKSYEYWVIDSKGFYDPTTIELAQVSRKNTKFVDNLLGNFDPTLPDNYFDLVFSISVLEHTEGRFRKSVCQDMYRCIKKGGYIVHSLDTITGSPLGKLWFDDLVNAGFNFNIDQPELSPDFYSEDGILTEPLDSVVQAFGGKTLAPRLTIFIFGQKT